MNKPVRVILLDEALVCPILVKAPEKLNRTTIKYIPI